MTTEDLMKLMGDFPEINPSNYGDDDVNALNAWGIAAHTALEALGREVEQWKVDFNEVLIERDQARAQLAAIRAQEPVAWNHGCNALCADIDLWIDHCPHCGKPRPAAPAPQEKDAARLDWYEANATHVISVVDTWYSRAGYLLPMTKRKSLRAAIDAAMGITGEPK